MYFDLLKTVSDNNKYWKWYTSIISTAKNRQQKGYVEKHHILPRSFNMGGQIDVENIVFLTAREHYLVHRLLPKFITAQKLKRKMYFAIWQMSNRAVFFRTSSQYEQAKKKFNASMKELWEDEDYRLQRRASVEWYYTDEESQKKNSEVQKEYG